MYNRENSLYYDSPGTFFYNYGDHAYSDGARAEGLVAAYYLAERMGKKELAAKFRQANIEVAKSLLHTYHSPESSFFHINPQKSIRSFRFKFTRQWVRVDSVQHTACFYARLYSKL
jgi:GH15 family glucan-1,4-alpha-glucosidase